MIQIDHIGIPARKVEVAAHFLCDVLGLQRAEPEGPEDAMVCVTISATSSV
jgi:catechol 2,3-dioxygenase-like lactoylglutathione lyase family enzyme